MEKIGFGQIGFEKLGLGETILEVAGNGARVTIGVLKEKLGLNGDGFGEGCRFNLGIRVFEMR